MKKLTLNKITLLQTQIASEITRLKQTPTLNLEQEQAKYEIYKQLTQALLETHV